MCSKHWEVFLAADLSLGETGHKVNLRKGRNKEAAFTDLIFKGGSVFLILAPSASGSWA